MTPKSTTRRGGSRPRVTSSSRTAPSSPRKITSNAPAWAPTLADAVKAAPRGRVYLAGPMTGRADYNFPAFDAAAARWRAAGWDVVSPADLTRALWLEWFDVEFDAASADPATVARQYPAFMRADLAALLTCNAVAFLPEWRASTGATREHAVATWARLAMYDAETARPLEAETALDEASRLVHGDRGADYGHPFDDYTRTGRMWGAMLGIPDIDPRVCAEMMVALKLSREVNRSKRDNRVDAAGYAECAQMIADEQDRRRAGSTHGVAR